jgi:hypothetical protein
MKILWVLYVSAQLTAFALLGLHAISPESGFGSILAALAVGAWLVTGGTGVVLIVLFVLRLIRAVARVGVLRVVGSLVGLGRDEDVFEDVVDEAMGFGAADERFDASLPSEPDAVGPRGPKWVVVGRAPIEDDERPHESTMSAQETRDPSQGGWW